MDKRAFDFGVADDVDQLTGFVAIHLHKTMTSLAHLAAGLVARGDKSYAVPHFWRGKD